MLPEKKNMVENELLDAEVSFSSCNILDFFFSYLIVNEIHHHSKDTFIFIDCKKTETKQKITRSSLVLQNTIFLKRRNKGARVHW